MSFKDALVTSYISVNIYIYFTYWLREALKEQLRGNTTLLCNALLLAVLEASLIVPSSKNQILFSMLQGHSTTKSSSRISQYSCVTAGHRW